MHPALDDIQDITGPFLQERVDVSLVTAIVKLKNEVSELLVRDRLVLVDVKPL